MVLQPLKIRPPWYVWTHVSFPPVPAYGSIWVVLWLFFFRSAHSMFPQKTGNLLRGHFWESLVFRLHSKIGQIHLSIEAQCDHHNTRSFPLHRSDCEERYVSPRVLAQKQLQCLNNFGYSILSGVEVEFRLYEEKWEKVC